MVISQTTPQILCDAMPPDLDGRGGSQRAAHLVHLDAAGEIRRPYRQRGGKAMAGVPAALGSRAPDPATREAAAGVRAFQQARDTPAAIGAAVTEMLSRAVAGARAA